MIENENAQTSAPAPEAAAEAPAPVPAPNASAGAAQSPAPDDRETALAERESELRRRELRLLALDALCARELPPELLPVLPLSDEPALTAALDGVESAFRGAVEGYVQKRMAGAPPTLPAGGPSARELALRRAMGLD